MLAVLGILCVIFQVMMNYIITCYKLTIPLCIFLSMPAFDFFLSPVKHQGLRHNSVYFISKTGWTLVFVYSNNSLTLIQKINSNCNRSSFISLWMKIVTTLYSVASMVLIWSRSNGCLSVITYMCHKLENKLLRYVKRVIKGTEILSKIKKK